MRIVEKRPRKLISNPKRCYTYHFISIVTLLKTSSSISRELIGFGKTRYFQLPISGKLYLDYPLGCMVEVEYKDVYSVGELCHIVAKAYELIYRSPSKYGVYGHEIGALHIEGFDLHHDCIIIPHIGS